MSILKYLKEELSGNTFYHATQSENIDNIIENGYKLSNGKHKYGVGVYGTSDIESQLSKLQHGNYGDTIIRNIIPSGDFMYFTKDRKDYADQFIKLFGADDKYQSLIKLLNSNKNPTHIAQFFSAYQREFPEIHDKLDGVYIDDKGTHIIVSYKPSKLHIKDISNDNGHTWKPI